MISPVHIVVECDITGYTGDVASGNCACADGYTGCGWSGSDWDEAQGTFRMIAVGAQVPFSGTVLCTYVVYRCYTYCNLFILLCFDLF